MVSRLLGQYGPYWEEGRKVPVCGCSGLRRGALAYDSQGRALGLITCDKPHPVKYPDGSTKVAWTGIHLTREGPETSPIQIGDVWLAEHPSGIGDIEELLSGYTIEQMERRHWYLVAHDLSGEAWPSVPEVPTKL